MVAGTTREEECSRSREEEGTGQQGRQLHGKVKNRNGGNSGRDQLAGLAGAAGATGSEGGGKTGMVPVGGAPTVLRDYLDAEISKWRKVVAAAGIKPE